MMRQFMFVFLVMVAASNSRSAKEENHESGEVKVVSIKMQGYDFSPDKITIAPGTTVKWINAGKHVHTVTDEHQSWDSGNVNPGEKYSRRFDQKGTFKYYCIPHREARMTGTIIVK